MKILNYKEINKGSMAATFTVFFEKMELNISCILFKNDKSRWIGLPNRQYEADGVKKYQWLTWFSKDKHKAFEEACLRIIDAGEFEKEQKPVQKEASVFKDDEECPF